MEPIGFSDEVGAVDNNHASNRQRQPSEEAMVVQQAPHAESGSDDDRERQKEQMKGFQRQHGEQHLFASGYRFQVSQNGLSVGVRHPKLRHRWPRRSSGSSDSGHHQLDELFIS